MDYQVKIRVRNGRIVKRMRECGYEKLSEVYPCGSPDYVRLSHLISMKVSALRQDGFWRPEVLRLCDKLNCVPEDLFNDRQMTAPLRKNEAETFVDEGQLVAIMSHGIEATEAKLTVEKLLGSLLPRERAVVEARLEGATYCEIGQQFNVGGGRIQQIERKAHAKMQKAATSRLMIAA